MRGSPEIWCKACKREPRKLYWQAVHVSAQRSFHAFSLLGQHPQTPLEHDEIMQLCCAIFAQRWSLDGWISAGLELRLDIQ